MKTVKGKTYISVRKGGKERNLGPYSEELWTRLNDLGMVKVKPASMDGNVKVLLAGLRRDLDEQIMKNRALEDELSDLRDAGKDVSKMSRDKLSRKVAKLTVEVKRLSKDVVKLQTLCALPIPFVDVVKTSEDDKYLVRKDGSFIRLQDELDEIEEWIGEVENLSVLKILWETSCPECESTRADNTALQVRCVKCGRQSWIGFR